jgi:acetyl esterase/lipase
MKSIPYAILGAVAAFAGGPAVAQTGVDAELHIWDGMWHSFFSDPEMPESREAYAVMARFFDRHLGH